MKRGKWNSTFSCWKKVGAHNCRLSSLLRMSFGWFMGTHKMTLFSKKIPKTLKKTYGTGTNIMKCPLLHIDHYSL